MREGLVKKNAMKSVDEDDLREEFQYFKVPLPGLLIFEGGDVLSTEHKNKITEWLPNAKKFTLIYKATKDGFRCEDFHKNCDDKGPTLTIVQSPPGPYIFGGYTSQDWDCSGQYKADKHAFIFTLVNPHNLPPTKYSIKPDRIQHAICCHPSGCSIFGTFDLVIPPHSNQSEESISQFPVSYEDTTGKGNTTFTGKRLYQTSEVEVYSVISPK